MEVNKLKKLSVKIISIALAICLLIGVVPMSIFAEESDNNVYVDVTLEADKTDYADGDSIVFNGAISNSSSKDCDADVEISLYATPSIKLDTKSLKVNALASGESHDLTVEAAAKRTRFGFELVQAIYDIITGYLYTIVLEVVSLFSSNYECVRVYIDGVPAAVMYKVDSSVVLNNGDDANPPTPIIGEKGVVISESSFEYDDATSSYYFVELVENIVGSLGNPADVNKFSFKVTDTYGNTLDSGDIDIAQNWNSNNIDFMLGENNLTVFAEYNDGTTVTDSISVNCYSDGYMDNLQIDTEKDTDGDKLVDYLEENYTNTNIQESDTDGDGLTDYEEAYLFKYNPLSKDTDNNGVTDPNEDFDSDSISNIDEINMGTDPTYSDSDLDGLDDFDEISTYKTDPMKKDTDSDGVSDGDEVRIGSNPIIKEDTFIETQDCGNVSDNTPVAVKVSAQVAGDQVGSLDVEPVSYEDNKMISPTIPGFIGNAYDFSVDGEINSAELVFEYDPSLGEIGDDFQPRVYYFNEITKMFEELPNQTVENGKVTVTVEHFSTYILLNKVEFDKVWNEEIKPPEYEGNGMTGIDVVFVVDSSGSMSSNDRNKIRIQAVKQFIDKLGENDRGAVVDFDGSSRVYQTFTSDHDLLYSAINRVDSSGGTSLSAGMSSAINLFTNSDYTRTDAYKYIVFLTDGDGDYSSSYTTSASNNNIVVYTVGLGSGVRENVLKNIANGTGGKYYFASTASNLPDIYNEVSFETVDYTTDSNNDGISDYYTELLYNGTLALSNGSDDFVGINFNYGEDQDPNNLCADFDGDGLLNGEELVISTNGNRVYVKMVSDPCMVHSDNDGINDKEETDNNTDPMVADYYPTDSIKYMLDDGNYTYQDVFEGESDFCNSIARNIWSSITLNFSHKDEAQAIVTAYLNSLSSVEKISDLAEETEKELAKNLIIQVIDAVSEGINLSWDTIETVDELAHLKINMKRWESAANSAKNLSPEFWTQLKAKFGLIKKWSKSWKWVTTVGKVADYLPVIGAGIAETADLVNIAHTYSMLAATSENFVAYEEILSTIVSNDNMDEKYVAKGVEPILASLRNSNNNFTNDICRDIAVSTSENLVSLGITLVSANPYVLAINVIVNLVDIYLSDITEGAYALFVVKEMVDAAKKVFDYNSYGSKSHFEEPEKINIKFIYGARCLGGKYAKQIVQKQLFVGEKDSVARARICGQIDTEEENMLYHCGLLKVQ